MLLKVGVAMMAVALAFAAAVAVAAFLSADPAELATAVKSTRKPAVEPLTRSDPGVDPRVEKNIPPPRLEPETRQAPVAEVVAAPPPKSNPQLEIKSEPGPRPEPKPGAEPEAPPDPAPQPEPEAQPEQGILPVSEEDWPSPTDEELRAADDTRRYDLPPGAIMGLTIKAMGLRGVPVIDSDSQWAFDSGVVHEPETSLPWSDTPQRNVYLAAHRLGYRGTWSRLVFYNLDELEEGTGSSSKTAKARPTSTGSARRSSWTPRTSG